MWLLRRVVVIILAGVALAPLVGASPARRTARSSAPDSIAVRVMFKSWGGPDALELCNGMDWGWDTLTWRLSAGTPVPRAFLFITPEFRVLRVVSADSAWMALRGTDFNPSDSFFVTSHWTPTVVLMVKDAEAQVRMRLVNPWPEPPTKPIRTTTVRGSVVDDSTECAVYFCQVVVEGTKCSAYSDTLGAFVLNDVPLGLIDVDACAGGYISKHMELHVPKDALAVRLRRDPRIRFTMRCR